MPKAEQIYHKRELEKGFYYAQAVRAGNTLYVSGCVSWDANGKVIGEGDMRAQVHAVYTDLKETLAAHGATFEHLSDLKGRHIGLPVIHASAHVGIDRHEPVPHEHLSVLKRLERGFGQGEIVGGGDAGGT